MEIETKYFVRYRLDSVELTIEAGPYDARGEALIHAADVAGYDDVTFTDVIERECWVGRDAA